MKKLLTTVIGLAILGSALAMLPEPAQVFTGESCTCWFDATGACVFVPDSQCHYVYTYSKNGNVNVSIKGTLPEGAVLPDKAMQFTSESTGYICNWDAPNFKGVTTPSGQFSYQCRN